MSALADRLALPASYRDADIGFRCAQDLPPPDRAAAAPKNAPHGPSQPQN